MTKNNPVYLAWQSPDTRDWHVVGALTDTQKGFEFRYTQGATSSKNFVPFSGMEDLHTSYVSIELFPLFHNRLLSERRPEYPRFIKWLGLKDDEITPVNILARSGGMRGTDQLQMFRRININESGSFEHYFFLHGVSHLSKSAQRRIDALEQGEQLRLCLDCQNEYDNHAVMVRAEDPAEIVGYCPRYLARDIKALLTKSTDLVVSVESIAKDAPMNYRLLCKISGHVVDGDNTLPTQSEYKFLV
ncbi:HIRAN domain-containing protein [Vibrio parahaemolyticus]